MITSAGQAESLESGGLNWFGGGVKATTNVDISGERLRQFRLRRDLTQEQLGQKMGVSGRRVQQLEKAVAEGIYVTTLRTLAAALGEPVAQVRKELEVKSVASMLASGAPVGEAGERGPDVGAVEREDVTALYTQLDALLERIAKLERCSVEDLLEGILKGEAAPEPVRAPKFRSPKPRAAPPATPAKPREESRAGGGGTAPAGRSR